MVLAKQLSACELNPRSCAVGNPASNERRHKFCNTYVNSREKANWLESTIDRGASFVGVCRAPACPPNTQTTFWLLDRKNGRCVADCRNNASKNPKGITYACIAPPKPVTPAPASTTSGVRSRQQRQSPPKAGPEAKTASQPETKPEPVAATPPPPKNPEDAISSDCKLAALQSPAIQCRQAYSDAELFCDSLSYAKQKLSSGNSAAGGFGQGMSTLQACAYALDNLTPTHKEIEKVNNQCSQAVRTCNTSCSSLPQRVTACYSRFKQNYSASSIEEMERLMAQVSEGTEKCEPNGVYQTSVNETKADLGQIMNTISSANTCVQQIMEKSQSKGNAAQSPFPLDVSPCTIDPNSAACRGLGEQTCSNPEYFKTSVVCQCSNNPTAANCVARQKTAESTYAGASTKGGGGSSGGPNLGITSADLSGGGNVNPASLIAPGKGGEAGNGPGGSKGGAGPGSSSTGGGGAPGGQSGGAPAAGASTDILSGWRASGGGEAPSSGGSSDGQPLAGGSGISDSNALPEATPNLDEYRPDMAYDPKFNRGIAGVAGPDGIRGAYTNIFDNMNEAFRRLKYTFEQKESLKQK